MKFLQCKLHLLRYNQNDRKFKNTIVVVCYLLFYFSLTFTITFDYFIGEKRREGRYLILINFY